jgi:hypothetical protein
MKASTSWSLQRISPVPVFPVHAVVIGLASACLLAGLLAGLLSGCGMSSGARSTALTSFHIVRTEPYPDGYLAPFAHTVTDAHQAVKVYEALQALPAYPKGIMYCPIDFGVRYQVTFFSGASKVSWATLEPGGCEAVKLADGSVRWAATHQEFWQTLAAAVGVPVAALFPMPGGSRTPSPG